MHRWLIFSVAYAAVGFVTWAFVRGCSYQNTEADDEKWKEERRDKTMKEETLRKCADLCKPGVYGCEACDYRHREEDELSCQQILARDLAALEETDGKND